MSDFIPFGPMKKTPEHLFHIPALFCPKCDEWRDFYINEAAAFCDCCHEQLTASDKDIEAVSGRSPRTPSLRLSGLVGGTELHKSHKAHIKNNNLA